MSRYKVDQNGNINIGGNHYNSENLPEQLEWVGTDSHGYALVWDENLWQEYNTRAHEISQKRKECTTPNGVLKKIYDIINT